MKRLILICLVISALAKADDPLIETMRRLDDQLDQQIQREQQFYKNEELQKQIDEQQKQLEELKEKKSGWED